MRLDRIVAVSDLIKLCLSRLGAMVLSGRFRLKNKNGRRGDKSRGDKTTHKQEGEKGKFKSCVLDDRH